MEHSAYCLSCSSSVPLKDAEVVTSKNGRRMVHGSCSKCSKRVRNFLKKDGAPAASASADASSSASAESK